MQTSSQNKMAVQPIAPLMFRIGLPIVLSMILQAAYNVVDSAYLARMTTGGEDALTALSLAFPVQLFMVAVSIGTGVGTNALLAKLLGLGDRGSANRTVGNAQTLAIILSAVLMLFSLLGVRPYVYSQSAGGSINSEVLDMAIDYLHICCGIPFGIVLFSVYEKVLQATGRSLYSTIAQIAGAVVNIILDPIFIFGYCGQALSGTTGAAVATVIGQFCGAGMTLYFNTRKNPDIQISFKGFRPSAKAIGRIYTVGLPSIAMQCVGSLMTFGMNLILMAFSATAVAVFGVYFKLQSFVFMPIFGLNNGMVPIISYNYGARRPDRVKKTIKLAVCYAECIMLAGFCIFQFAPRLLLSIFAASDAMLAIGIPAMRIICLHFLLAGVSIVLSSVFQALGNGMFSLIVSICRQLVVLIPAAWLLSRTGEVNMVWWAFIIAEVVSLALSLVFMARINRPVIAPLTAKQDAAV